MLSGVAISATVPTAQFFNGGLLVKEGADASAITSRFLKFGELRIDAGLPCLGNLGSLEPNGRLVQGRYVVSGALALPGSGVVAIDAPASVALVGPGASLTDSGGLDALRNLAEIGSPFAADGGGSPALTGGASAAISGALVNRSFTASDAFLDFPWIVSLDDGDVVGLGRATFAVGGGATGFVDLFDDPIAFETSPGVVTVIPANVVPEPASAALLALTSAPLLVAASRRRPA